MKRQSLLGFGLSLIGSASLLIVWALPIGSQELTDSELGILKQQIVKRVRETEKKNYRPRNTSEVDRKSLIEYRNFWRKQDSKLSDLLGEWGGAWGYSITIFPSKKPNQVCIQYVDESEVTVEAATFKSGKIYWNSPSSKIFAVLLRESNSLVFITKSKDNINILPQPISALPRLSSSRSVNSSPYSNLGCIVETSVLALQQALPKQSATSQSSSKPNTQTPNTLTWQQHINSKASGGGRFSPYIQVDYDLPQEFRNGYIYRIEGVNTLWLYILKQGLPKYPSVFSNKSEQIDRKIADQYIREGKAILLQHSFSGSDERYSNRNVNFPKSGVGCLKRVCLTATFMTNTQIGNILLSQRAIGNVAASRSPSTAQQYKEQGDSKSRNGDKQGAISDYTSAIRLNSSFAVAYYNRAIDRVSVGDQQGALADFRKAAELFKQQGKGSDQRDALNEIAKLQGKQPKQQEAKRSLLITANASSIRGATVEPGEKQKLKDLQWNAATQIVMDRLNCRELPNKSRVCSLDLYNLGYANAVVEVYDAQHKLVEIRGVEGVRNPSSVFGFPVESVERLFKLSNGFGFNDPRISIGQQKLTEIRNLVIPPRGSFKITKSGVNADNYNNATFLIGFFFDSELNLLGSLPGSLQKIFGEDAAFRQTLLAALFVKVQEERTKNIVKDGGFNDPPRAFLTGQWIDQESFSNLVEVGVKVLAEESLKKRTKRVVINQVVLGKKLNVWVTAGEVFAKSGNGFLQYFNRDQSQKAERQQGGIVFPKNN